MFRELVLAIGIPLLLLLLLAVLALEHRHRADHRSVPAALAAAALRLREWGSPGSRQL